MPRGQKYLQGGGAVSDADRRLVAQMRANKGGRTISDADRRLIEQMLASEGGGTISDADRLRAQEETRYLRRNDGGIAQKTRTF
jgi:hypothetical protein